jgi:hypothetical protein
MHHVLAYLSHADLGQPILISDSAYDQSLITRDWTVLKWTSHHVQRTGAFAGQNVGEKFLVVIGAAKLQDESGNVYAAIANEVLYDDNKAQIKSLLSIHQALANPQNGIDDCAHCEHDVDSKPGRQKARFGSKEVSFFFDRSKCFFEISTITKEEMDTLPRIYIHGQSTKEYVPLIRAHSCRSTQSDPLSNLPPWRYYLGFIPNHVVDKTLSATMQMVETREHMLDLLVSRLLELKVHCVNDTACVNIFFSSITSVWGFTCWTQYYFLKSGFDVVYLM